MTEDLLNTVKLEIIQNGLNIPTYPHYNDNGNNPDLTLASADIGVHAVRGTGVRSWLMLQYEFFSVQHYYK